MNTPHFDRIVAEGTSSADYDRTGKPSNKIACADGFTLSVIAGGGAYCSPRVGYDTMKFEADQIVGPYWEVEVGYPSERPEPWADWAEFCESPDSPTSTVYGYVPADTVRALILSHGGEVNA